MSVACGKNKENYFFAEGVYSDGTRLERKSDLTQ